MIKVKLSLAGDLGRPPPSPVPPILQPVSNHHTSGDPFTVRTACACLKLYPIHHYAFEQLLAACSGSSNG